MEFFLGDGGRALRVSRYFRTHDQEPLVRVSVWDEHGEARAALSIDEDEAARLAAFLRPPRAAPRRSFRRYASSRSNR